MPKNIVICCDGTGNQIDAKLSNVLKLFRVVRKDADQVVFYDPGVGTISSSEPWSRWKNDALGVLGLATGYGLDDGVLAAYSFLIDTYQKGDRVFLFGFSRGAYSIRVLAGFLHLVGLLPPAQKNLSDYALTAYKRAAERDDLPSAWEFERIASTRHVPIKFMGVWDTVSSVIVPRPDRFYIPSLQTLPYTRKNPSVEIFRHAMAIDERRRMFRLNRWIEPQTYQPSPFHQRGARPQDVKQVWFAGVHADIGGGYPEGESAAAKFPLQWVIDEAVAYGLRVNKMMYNHLVLGHPREGGHTYVAPSASARLNNSMNGAWSLLEFIPKRTKWRDGLRGCSVLGQYIPLSELRRINEDAWVHYSVLDRIDADRSYRPFNLPPRGKINIEGNASAAKGSKTVVNSSATHIEGDATRECRWICVLARLIVLTFLAASAFVLLSEMIFWLRYGGWADWRVADLWEWAGVSAPQMNWIGAQKIWTWVLTRRLWLSLAIFGVAFGYPALLCLEAFDRARTRPPGTRRN
jgi:uncharacterized protein (DUF2235 family)